MTSEAKKKSNRQNSAHSTGPRTNLGKERVKLNAKKHGIFSCEPIVNEPDRQAYQAMRRDLRNQFPPVTPLRDIASEKIVWAAWSHQRAMQLHMQLLDALLSQGRAPDALAQAAGKDAISANFCEAGNKDVRQRLRVLRDLRAEIETYGLTHADKWRDSIINCFGLRFYQSLTEWPMMSKSAILQADHLHRHAEIFKKPLPPLESDTETKRLVVDPLQNWHMIMKLIDVEIDHLEQLLLSNDGHPSKGSANFDLSLRYLVSTSRELERRVDWYRYLEERGL